MSPTAKTDILVVLVAFLLNGFELAPLMSFGPFFIQFQNIFQASASQSSLVLSLLIGSYHVAGIISSMSSCYLGFRKTIFLGASLATTGSVVCCFSQSIITVQALAVMIGLGCGLGTVPRFTVIGSRFNKKRSLANNIVTMGGAFMAIPLPIVYQYWSTKYTWHGSMLLIGGMFLNLIPLGMLLTALNHENKTKGAKIKKINLHLLKNWKFVCFMMTCGCAISSIIVPGVFLVRFAQHKGFGDYMAASMISIDGFLNIIIRPLSGYLTSRSRIGPVSIVRPYVFAAGSAIQAGLVISMTFCSSWYSIVIVVALISACTACRGALTITMAADFFGEKALVTSLGMRSLSQGIFAAFIPPMFGRIVDASGSYDAPFYGGAILNLLAAALSVLIHCNIEGPEQVDSRIDPT